MVTDDELLGYVTEILGKLSPERSLHIKIADVCYRLQGLLRQAKMAPSSREAPKRDRAAYMRQWRAKQK